MLHVNIDVQIWTQHVARYVSETRDIVASVDAIVWTQPNSSDKLPRALELFL